MKFLKKVLIVCEGKPLTVVDRRPWYTYVLKRLGLNYLYERFGNRNRVERFYNNINTRNMDSMLDFAIATTTIINLSKTIRLQRDIIPS